MKRLQTSSEKQFPQGSGRVPLNLQEQGAATDAGDEETLKVDRERPSPATLIAHRHSLVRPVFGLASSDPTATRIAQRSKTFLAH